MMIELDRSEKIILEMDRLANENHSHVATIAEIDANRGNWWIRSNMVNFDTMPNKASTWFQETIVDIVPPKESGGQEALWKVVTKFLIMVAMAHKLVGTRLWEFTTKIEWPLIERGNLCTQ